MHNFEVRLLVSRRQILLLLCVFFRSASRLLEGRPSDKETFCAGVSNKTDSVLLLDILCLNWTRKNWLVGFVSE